MACCIVAAYLYSQMVAILHRWSVFWGLARRAPGEDALPTLVGLLRGTSQRPALSTVVISAAICMAAVALIAEGAGYTPTIHADEMAVPRISMLLGL